MNWGAVMDTAPFCLMEKSEIIILPTVTKSPNKILREHWSTRRKLKQSYQFMIRSEINKYKIKNAEPQQPFNLVIIAIRKRKLDIDNNWGSMKLLIDALCDELFIWDDDPVHLKKLSVHQFSLKEKGVKEQQTQIRRIGI